MHIGFDLGGTKLAAIALDGTGRELGRSRRVVPRSYDDTIAELTQYADDLERRYGPAMSIGIALPGIIDAAGGVLRVVNLPWLERQPLAMDLVERTGRPVAIANDANCFALSEAIDGAGSGVDVVFGVILGTGVGGGIVVGGRVLVGANAIAGEWGHNLLPEIVAATTPPPLCSCGRTGCIEAWLNGAGLSRSYRELTGQDLTAADIARRAGQGEQQAMAVLDRYQRRLAAALGTIINLLDPEIIVLGGGLSQIDSLYRTVPSLWAEFMVAKKPATRLVKARFGPESGLRGAAWLGAQAAQKNVRIPSITR